MIDKEEYKKTLLGVAVVVIIGLLVALAIKAPKNNTMEFQPEYSYAGQEMAITVTYHDSDRDLLRLWEEEYGGTSDSRSRIHNNGFSVLYNGPKCEIHVVRPDTGNDMNVSKRWLEVMGEEMTHCLHGAFHDVQGEQLK